MDQEYMTKMATSFLAELAEIEKRGFAPVRALSGGFRRLGQAFSTKVDPGVAEKGLGWAQRLGGRGAVRAGGLGAHIKQIYQAGASRLGKSGDPRGMLGGMGAVARSRHGQMAGAAGLTGLGAYGGYRALAD